MSWKSCGSGAFDIATVELRPDPAKAGTVVEVDIAATLASDAGTSEGSIQASISYLGTPIFTETLDLCKVTTCPVAAGDGVKISYAKEIPLFIPVGEFVMELKAVNGSTTKEPLFCVAVDFHVVEPFKAEAEETTVAATTEAEATPATTPVTQHENHIVVDDQARLVNARAAAAKARARMSRRGPMGGGIKLAPNAAVHRHETIRAATEAEEESDTVR